MIATRRPTASLPRPGGSNVACRGRTARAAWESRTNNTPPPDPTRDATPRSSSSSLARITGGRSRPPRRAAACHYSVPKAKSMPSHPAANRCWIGRGRARDLPDVVDRIGFARRATKRPEVRHGIARRPRRWHDCHHQSHGNIAAPRTSATRIRVRLLARRVKYRLRLLSAGPSRLVPTTRIAQVRPAARTIPACLTFVNLSHGIRSWCSPPSELARWAHSEQVLISLSSRLRAGNRLMPTQGRSGPPNRHQQGETGRAHHSSPSRTPLSHEYLCRPGRRPPAHRSSAPRLSL